MPLHLTENDEVLIEQLADNINFGILTIGASNHNPASSGQTYYMCTVYDLGVVTNSNLREIKLPYDVNIIAASATIQVGGTLGASEDSAAIKLFNKDTNTIVDTIIDQQLFFNSSVTTTTTSNLNIPMQANIPYVIAIQTPLFSITPTTVRYSCNIWIKKI
jgi:hypothetical protein